MYYMRILTKYNEIKLILEDGTFYDDDLQNLLQQEYIREVYLRWIDEKEYERNQEYNKVRKLERKDKNVSNRI